MRGYKGLALEILREDFATESDDLNGLIGVRVETFIDTLTTEIAEVLDALEAKKASPNANAMLKHHGYPKGKYTELQVEKAMARYDHSDCPGNSLDEFEDVVRGCPVVVRRIKAAKAAALEAAA